MHDLLAFEDSDGKVIAASDEFVNSVTVEIDEGKCADVVTADGPKALLAVEVESSDRTISTHNDNRLAYVWKNVAAAESDGGEAIVYFFVENILVIATVVYQEVGTRTDQKQICRWVSGVQGATAQRTYVFICIQKLDFILLLLSLLVESFVLVGALLEIDVWLVNQHSSASCCTSHCWVFSVEFTNCDQACWDGAV